MTISFHLAFFLVYAFIIAVLMVGVWLGRSLHADKEEIKTFNEQLYQDFFGNEKLN